MLTGWGLGVVFIGEVRPADIDLTGTYLFGAGLGAVAGLLLARSGFEVSDMGLAATVAAAGLLLALSPTWPDVLDDSRTYAALIGLVGIVNVGIGAAAQRGGEGS